MPLGTGELLLQPLQEARVFDMLSLCRDAEFLEPDVDAELVAAVFQRQEFLLDAEGHEVFARGGAADGGVEDFSVEAAAQLGFHEAELRQANPASLDADAVPLVAGAVALLELALGLELRVAGAALEKVLVGRVQIPKRFLEGHRIHVVQPSSVFPALEVGEEAGRFFVIDSVVVGLPLVDAEAKEMVVHESGTAERAVDEMLLLCRGVDAELVALGAGFHVLLPPFCLILAKIAGYCGKPSRFHCLRKFAGPALYPHS